MTACRPEGERGERDSRNNRLRPEKVLLKCFRTGVQFPPPPPKRKTRLSACLSFWVPPPKGRLHLSVIKMLGANELPLCQGFRPRRKRLCGAKAPPHCVGPKIYPHLYYFGDTYEEVRFSSSFVEKRTSHFLKALDRRAFLFCTAGWAEARGLGAPSGIHAPSERTAARAALMRLMSMGFAMWPFMPAARAAAMSSSKALAVMARMGMEPASERSS